MINNFSLQHITWYLFCLKPSRHHYKHRRTLRNLHASLSNEMILGQYQETSRKEFMSSKNNHREKTNKVREESKIKAKNTCGESRGIHGSLPKISFSSKRQMLLLSFDSCPLGPFQGTQALKIILYCLYPF